MTQLDQSPKHSPLAQSVTRNGKTVAVDIYEDGEGGWLLEVVDEYGNSTVWDAPFATDQEALDEALKTIDDEGIDSLIGSPSGGHDVKALDQPLSDAEIDELDDFLADEAIEETSMDVSTLEGFLTAIAIGPRAAVLPSRGIRWDQRHTQRLREARIPEKHDLLRPGIGSRIAGYWIAGNTGHSPEELSLLGGDPAIHGVEPAESDVWMNIADRVGHTLVLGTTRVGKTRLAELLIAQDIRRGEVVIVFDPKGDIDLLRRVYAEAKRAGREGQFFMCRLGSFRDWAFATADSQALAGDISCARRSAVCIIAHGYTEDSA